MTNNLPTIDIKGKKYKVTYSYLAGLIDGEGYVGIRRCTTKHDGSLIPEFKPTVVITNTNYHLMQVLKDNFYGSICHRNRGLKILWKESYSFEFNRSEIRKILPKVMKYLLIKKGQAQTVLDLFKTYKHTSNGNGYTSSEVLDKENLHKKCLLLNKRGDQNVS